MPTEILLTIGIGVIAVIGLLMACSYSIEKKIDRNEKDPHDPYNDIKEI